ncbi:DB domain-containing protein [Aphelenchoides bicaudatus]|nr:DB domain-containing protein [Aphelenchoides bicaudatus]
MLVHLSSILLITLVVQCTYACLPNGVCGLNPLCGGQSILPPIPPIGMAQPMGCGPGMSRGPYGCYQQRRAAHASSIYKPEKRNNYTTPWTADGSTWDDLEFTSPSVAALRRAPQSFVNPNRAFLNCCMDRKLPNACLKKCQYGEYRRDTIIGLYLKQDDCPLEAVREIQFCAAQGKDHRPCCERNGVATTLAGQKCLVFCDQRPGQVTQLDMTYLPCFERFDNMRSCFWASYNQYFKPKH